MWSVAICVLCFYLFNILGAEDLHPEMWLEL